MDINRVDPTCADPHCSFSLFGGEFSHVKKAKKRKFCIFMFLRVRPAPNEMETANGAREGRSAKMAHFGQPYLIVPNPQ